MKNPRTNMRSLSEWGSQKGVVLVVALIMLVIISLLASFSVRNATSSEAVMGNVRTTQLATQAAEIALKYCASGMDQFGSPSATIVVTPQSYQNTLRATHKDSSGNLDYWDGATSVTANAVIVVPLSFVGNSATYKRPPECMIEPIAIVKNGVLNTNSKYVITARGFGPEVAADDGTRKRPVGSEVWLQTTDE